MTPEDEYFREQASEFAQGRLDNVLGDWEDAKKRCESPIEVRLLAAMMNSAYLLDGHSYARVIFKSDVASYADAETLIVPQLEIGRYRVDFGVAWYRPESGLVMVAVECDGHEFHEKTKEQAQRDKSRDRALMGMGWPVLRFTGSEIYRDASNCAESVADAIFETWVRRVRPDMRGPFG